MSAANKRLEQIAESRKQASSGGPYELDDLHKLNPPNPFLPGFVIVRKRNSQRTIATFGPDGELPVSELE